MRGECWQGGLVAYWKLQAAENPCPAGQVVQSAREHSRGVSPHVWPFSILRLSSAYECAQPEPSSKPPRRDSCALPHQVSPLVWGALAGTVGTSGADSRFCRSAGWARRARGNSFACRGGLWSVGPTPSVPNSNAVAAAAGREAPAGCRRRLAGWAASGRTRCSWSLAQPLNCVRQQ